MNWKNSLCTTYDNLMMTSPENRAGLVPIAHSTQKAHIEITIDKCGNYVCADFVADKEGDMSGLSTTLIPVTESSSARSNGIEPHPLNDKLIYIAGDYRRYTGVDNTKYFEQYLSGLKKWNDSEYSTAKVNAIYQYVSKGTIIEDLLEDIFSLDEKGHLSKKWEKADKKLSVGEQREAFVRFIVSGEKVPETWLDEELQKKYTSYYIANIQKVGLCDVTGEITKLATLQPNKIRSSADKAKIISSNDKDNYTYRGIFHTANDAFQIGYQTSQKLHNALRYLIQKQGIAFGNRVYVFWGNNGELVPNIFADTFSMLGNPDLIQESNVEAECARQLQMAMTGYKSVIDPKSHFSILGLDSATVGRISVIYYRDLSSAAEDDLIEKITSWHTTAAWLHRYKFYDGNRVTFYGAPSPYDIAVCAYGIEKNGVLTSPDKESTNRIVPNAVEKLIPCIIEGQKIPLDILKQVYRNVTQPKRFSANNWEKILSVFCSLYKKYLWDYKGVETTMSAEENSYDSLSYQCGRLLAVADWAENHALNLKNEKRETNAMKLLKNFQVYPGKTWNVLIVKLAPYLKYLKKHNKSRYYDQLLDEIFSHIDPDDFQKAHNLDGSMMVGYFNQRADLVKRANKIKAEKRSKDEEKE